jgi:hypothetical protein
MINITRLILHLVQTKADNPSEIIKRKEIKIKPRNNENALRMKQDLAKKLQAISNEKQSWSYWYVSAEIESAEGTKAYRTIIGKTLF